MVGASGYCIMGSYARNHHPWLHITLLQNSVHTHQIMKDMHAFLLQLRGVTRVDTGKWKGKTWAWQICMQSAMYSHADLWVHACVCMHKTTTREMTKSVARVDVLRDSQPASSIGITTCVLT